MQVTTFAVDLAKRVFQVHGFDGKGHRVVTRRLKRAQFLRFFRERPERCRVVMEAGRSSHHWGRELRSLGYTPVLLPPQHVKPLVVGNKTDGNDADAIYEASLRPKIRPVAVKTVAQQEVQALHRVRTRLVKARTGLMNQVRGLLSEVGLVFPARAGSLRRALPVVLEDADNGLTPRLRALVAELWEEWRGLDTRIRQLDRSLEREASACEATRRLAEVPGVGPMIATAAVASVGNGQPFASARQFSSWLGLVPSEHSSGETRRRGGITKRGDTHLRTLLVHGARAALLAARRKDDPHSRWIRALEERRGHNRAVVALAHKMARILWALLVTGERYRPARA